MAQPKIFTLDTAGRHLKLVPIRSTTSQTETTTREAKMTSVRKIKTTTTSRQGSQTVVHVDTKTIVTSTTSKGVVVLRQVSDGSERMVVKSGHEEGEDLNLQRVKSREVGQNFQHGICDVLMKVELENGEDMVKSKRAFYTTRDYITDENTGFERTVEEFQKPIAINFKSFDESTRNAESPNRNKDLNFQKEYHFRQGHFSDTFQCTSSCGGEGFRNINLIGIDSTHSSGVQHPNVLLKPVDYRNHQDREIKPSLLGVNHQDTAATPSFDEKYPDSLLKPSLNVKSPSVSASVVPHNERGSLDCGSIWAIGQLVVTERTSRKLVSCYRDYLSA